MFDLYKDELDGNVYECIEDFNADVMRVSTELQEEIGRTERLILKADKEMLDDLGVEIKEVNDGDEEV